MSVRKLIQQRQSLGPAFVSNTRQSDAEVDSTQFAETKNERDAEVAEVDSTQFAETKNEKSPSCISVRKLIQQRQSLGPNFKKENHHSKTARTSKNYRRGV